MPTSASSMMTAQKADGCVMNVDSDTSHSQTTNLRTFRYESFRTNDERALHPHRPNRVRRTATETQVELSSTVDITKKTRISRLPSFAWFQMADNTVYTMLAAGATLEEVIAALCVEKSQMQDRITKLEAIAPRKLKATDGTTLIWRCPDDAIPEEQTP